MKRCIVVVSLGALPFLAGCIVVSLGGKSILEDEFLVGLLDGYGMTQSLTSAPAIDEPPPGGLTAHEVKLTAGESEVVISRFSTPASLLLLLIDPVILQVPAGFSDVSGTWNGTNPLDVQKGLTSLAVQPGVTLAAEPGHELVVIDFPPALAPGSPAIFDLRIGKPVSPGTPAAPIPLKVMLAAKAEVGGQTYYLPTFPCVTDFASVPEFLVPVGTAQGAPHDILALAVAALQGLQGCNGVVYGFIPPTTTTLPPEEKCGNCVDDDGDGLVDFDDPACCGGGSGELTLTRALIRPRRGVSRVALKGSLGKIDALAGSGSPEVQIQVREVGGETLWCAHVPADRLKGRSRSRRFRDRRGTLAGAQGLQDLQLRVGKRDGVARFLGSSAKGTLRPPKPGEVGVTVGLWQAASPTAGRCLQTVETFRSQRRGAVRFP
jgi:hypothetical protein